MELVRQIAGTTLATVGDVLPILIILVAFRLFVIRRRLANWRPILFGVIYVLVGLSFFLVGLEKALFPLGEVMARQLVELALQSNVAELGHAPQIHWRDFVLIYCFAAAIGFATTIAEPSLIAVALKAQKVSGGTIHPWGLRIAVAIGVAIGVAVGTLRIVMGTPLHYYIMVGYLLIILQTIRANRSIVPLAYDSGGVTTSTVTVPLVTALGLGLASSIPGHSPLIDGFGLIAFASLFPMITVMAYADIGAWWTGRRKKQDRT